MADETPAPAPEIDVDTLDDAAFDALKSEMRSEKPAKDAQEPSPASDGQKDQKTAEPAPAADEDDDTPLDANGKKQEFVPHAKFHQANERRKAAETEREKFRTDNAKLMDRMQQLIEAGVQPAQQQQVQQQAEPEIPDPDVDPQGAIKWVREQVLAGQKAEREQAKQREDYNAVEQVLNAVNDQLGAAKQADPHVAEAHIAWRNSLGNELLAMGYTQQQAIQQIAATEREHGVFIAQNRLPPGEYIKRVAAARGWAPKAAEQAPANDTGLSEADKITKREETRLASLSLGKGGGAVVNTGVPSPQEVIDMSDADFEAYVKKHGSVSHAFRQAS